MQHEYSQDRSVACVASVSGVPFNSKLLSSRQDRSTVYVAAVSGVPFNS